MMITLIYCALYIVTYFFMAIVFTMLTMIVVRDDQKRAAKIGVDIAQSFFLAVFLYYFAQANPLGIVLQ
jgi:hypothetical protein